MKEKTKKVFVGMSGGVDSSVAAALLKQAKPNNFEKLFGRPTPKGFRGFKVVGIFIKIEIAGDCSWRLERRSAFAAAAALDIPLYTIDLSREYEQTVIKYLLAEYRAGRTPNPDVLCNQTIKFGAFYDWAVGSTRTDADHTQINAERMPRAHFVATGHYGKIKGNSGSARTALAEQLFIPKDKIKDQTYFLWAIERTKLAKILFPLGSLTKNEVRKLARKFGLPNADKPDSQGLCFVGDFDFKKFLREKLGVKPGRVLDEKRKVIGAHDGAHLYTIGERHGFEIKTKAQKGTDERPYFVVAKDQTKNTLIVAHEPLTGAAEKVGEINLINTNWLSDPRAILKNPPRHLFTTVNKCLGGRSSDRIYRARLRHRGALTKCRLRQNPAGDWMVIFDEVIVSPAAGQSVVIYDGDICLGGGIIK